MQRRDFLLGTACTSLLAPLVEFGEDGSRALTQETTRPSPILDQVLAPATKRYPRNTEGDFMVLRNGKWLVVWSQFYGGAADVAGAQIAGIESSDAGQTWSRPVVVVANEGRMNTMSASLLRMQDDDLGLVFARKHALDDLKFYLLRSRDEGKYWRDLVCITPQPGYNSGLNACVIRLRSGRLLFPSHHASEKRSGRETFVSCTHYSDDDGRTWNVSNSRVTAPRRGAMEPTVIQLTDGRLLMTIRTQLGVIYQAFSKDEGATWSKGEPMRYRPGGDVIQSPEAHRAIARIPTTGDLLLVWNNNYEPKHLHFGRRTALSTAISKDDGRTWRGVKNLEEHPHRDYQYTSIRFVADRVVLLYSENVSLKLKVVPIQ